MTQQQAIHFARQYLWNESCFDGKNVIHKATKRSSRMVDEYNETEIDNNKLNPGK